MGCIIGYIIGIIMGFFFIWLEGGHVVTPNWHCTKADVVDIGPPRVETCTQYTRDKL